MRKVEKQYILNIKKNLPYVRNRKALLRDLNESVCTYCQDNPSVTLDDLYRLFGSPEEIAESMDEAEPRKTETGCHMITRRLLPAFAIFIILTGIFCVSTNYKNNSILPTTGENEASSSSYSSESTSPSESIHNPSTSESGRYAQYDIYRVGDTISYQISQGYVYLQQSEYVFDTEAENKSQPCIEYTVEDAVLYENIDHVDLSQTQKDLIVSSIENDRSQENVNHKFVVMTIRAKPFGTDNEQNPASLAVLSDPAEVFHLLSYTLLDKGLLYDSTPLVWYDRTDSSSGNSYYLSDNVMNGNHEFVFQIGFLLTDQLLPQDGLLLCVNPVTDVRQYIDLNIHI